MKENDRSLSTNNTSKHRAFEPWVSTATACKHLGISTPTFRRWLKAGRVKIRRTPTGELRFRISELNQLIG